MHPIKKLIIVILIIAAAIGIGLTFFSSKIDGLIAQEIEKYGTAALGTEVSVANVSTNMSSGSAVIRGFAIANPAGYESKNAFEVDSFSATVNYAERIIDEIIISAPVINAELIGASSNYQELASNLPDSNDIDSSDDSETNLSIKRFSLEKGQVNLIARETALDGKSFVMADMVINNLTGTPEQIANQIANGLSRHISAQVAGQLGDQLKDRARQELKEKALEMSESLRERFKDRVKPKRASEEP